MHLKRERNINLWDAYSLQSEVSPSCLQTTVASLVSQKASHTVPHCPWKHTSTRPSRLFLPPTSRISVLLQTATANMREKLIFDSIHMPPSYQNFEYVVLKTHRSHYNSFELNTVVVYMNKFAYRNHVYVQLHLLDKSLLHLHYDHSYGHQLHCEGNHQGSSHSLCSSHYPRRLVQPHEQRCCCQHG